MPTLRVLNPLTPTAAQTGTGATLQLMPGGVGPVASASLAVLAQGLQAGVAGGALPAAVAEPVGQLLRLMSRAANLTRPDTLAATLRDSGVFLEAGLRAADPATARAPQQDLKAGLFRALAAADAALARIDAAAMQGADAQALLELKRELEGGLGRIILHQLASQPVDGQQQNRNWQLEVPVLHAGTCHSLRIELEQERGRPGAQTAAEDGDDRWRVTLQLAPPSLGALEIRLQLQDDNLDLRIAAERPMVRESIDAGLGELQRALASRGITLVTTMTAALADATPVPESGAAKKPALDLRA